MLTVCIAQNTGSRKLSGSDSSQTILPSFITQQFLSEPINFAVQSSRAANVFLPKCFWAAAMCQSFLLLNFCTIQYQSLTCQNSTMFKCTYTCIVNILLCQVAIHTSSSTPLLNKDNGNTINQ